MAKQTATKENTDEVIVEENPMRKFDAPVLKGIGSTAMVDPGSMQFLPANIGEAMEFAKMMSQSNFVPPHLRDRPGDCLAVVMQSTRWGADPYAVANKTYFVNNRMTFEAQLVAAVVNTSRVLVGKLKVEWDGTGENMICIVRGHVKGEPEELKVWQELKTITTRNSPLWKQSVRQQLGYYTMRAWARLHTPEVLLGIYTPDELDGISDPAPGTQQVIPPRPTRESAKTLRSEDNDRNSHFREVMEDAPAKEVVDPKTGEVTNPNPSEPDSRENTTSEKSSDEAPSPSPAQGQAAPNKEPVDWRPAAEALINQIKKIGMLKTLDNFITHHAEDIDLLRTNAEDLYQNVMKAIADRKAWFAK